MALEIGIRSILTAPSVKCIELKGELDFSGSDKLIREFLSFIEERGDRYIIIDMHNLTYLNSAGIYSLLFCFNKTKKLGGYLKLVGPHARIGEILDIVGASKILPIYKSIEEALGQKD